MDLFCVGGCALQDLHLHYRDMQNTHPHRITLEEFQADRHGKTFADILNDPNIPFDKVLQFFNDPARQQRMEDSEIHHDRAPLAGVVRELESLAAVRDVLQSLKRRRSAMTAPCTTA